MVNSKLTLLVFASSALSAVVPREDPEAGHDHQADPELLPPSAPWGPPGSAPSNAEHHFPGYSIGEHEHGESGFFPPPEFTMSAPLQAAATGAPGAGPFPEQQQPHYPTPASFNSITQPSSDGPVPPFGSVPTQAPQVVDSSYPADTSGHAPPAPGSSHIRPPPRPSGEPIRPLSTFTQTPRPHPSNGAPPQPSQGVEAGGHPPFDHPESSFGSYGPPPGPPHAIPTEPAKPSEDAHPKEPTGDTEGPGPKHAYGGPPPPFQEGSGEPPHPSGPEGQPPHPGPDGPPGGPPGEPPHSLQPEWQQPHPEGQSPHSGGAPPPQTDLGETPHPSGSEGQPPHPGPGGPPGKTPHLPQPEEQQPHPEGQPPHSYGGPPPSQPEGHPAELGDHQGGPPCPYAAEHGRPPFGEEPSGSPAGPREQGSGSPPFHVGIPEQHNPHPIGELAEDHGDHPMPPHAMPEGEPPCPEEHPEPPHNPHSSLPVLGLASSGKSAPGPGAPSGGKPGSREFEKPHSSSVAAPSRSPLPSKASMTKQSPPQPAQPTQPTQKTTGAPSPKQSPAQFSSNAVMSKKAISTGLAGVVIGLLLALQDFEKRQDSETTCSVNIFGPPRIAKRLYGACMRNFLFLQAFLFEMFTLLALAGSRAQATPVARASGFSSVCSDISLDSHFWLHATCPDDSGASVNSTVYLPLWIENDQGKLAWKDDGNFEYYCSDYALLNSGSTLEAYCQGTFRNQSGNSTLDLEEHIANYNGHLLSDLDGSPDTPTSSSTVPVPADPSLDITFSSDNTNCENGIAWPTTGPEDCWSFTYATGRATPFDSIQITTNPGWSIEGYNASDCSGTPSWTASSNDNQCVAFNNGSLAYFKMTPLWNWD
ncbi:uncharacterized protein TRUGW13939_06878 [Talaromyces rugulosus]|uniref:Cyanovirin-N domain-containing protein n=1 Tax=Talaromyces rugulosus TaxID=121627 RepID=A0A7H8R106_TALRU|nr:uncharacterized protein TRUGW13939_06878 [Talaromyces rugulosus]QKX59736.1 hypothetical protein TRUGW13939_06878 [Talaromyces rugulosus]